MNALWVLALFSTILAVTECAEINNVTSCYYCSTGEHLNCKDPYNKETGTVRLCKDFEELDNSRSGAQSHPYGKAFAQEKSARLMGRTYKCVKVTSVLEDGSGSVLIRMCAPMEPTVDTACEYMKANIDEGYVMKSCYECNTDRCNGSSSIIAGVVSVVATSLLLLLQ